MVWVDFWPVFEGLKGFLLENQVLMFGEYADTGLYHAGIVD